MAKKSKAAPLNLGGKRGAGPIDKVIGQRIRQLRMQNQMSQAELADSLGLSFQQVQKYEKGINRTAPDRLVMIAKKLGTTVPDLMGLNSSTPLAVPDTPFDAELYKLALAFQRLPEHLRQPIRLLINKLSDPIAVE